MPDAFPDELHKQVDADLGGLALGNSGSGPRITALCPRVVEPVEAIDG
jgi:hypothetical protein